MGRIPYEACASVEAETAALRQAAITLRGENHPRILPIFQSSCAFFSRGYLTRGAFSPTARWSAKRAAW